MILLIFFGLALGDGPWRAESPYLQVGHLLKDAPQIRFEIIESQRICHMRIGNGWLWAKDQTLGNEQIWKQIANIETNDASPTLCFLRNGFLNMVVRLGNGTSVVYIGKTDVTQIQLEYTQLAYDYTSERVFVLNAGRLAAIDASNFGHISPAFVDEIANMECSAMLAVDGRIYFSLLNGVYKWSKPKILKIGPASTRNFPETLVTFLAAHTEPKTPCPIVLPTESQVLLENATDVPRKLETTTTTSLQIFVNETDEIMWLWYVAFGVLGGILAAEIYAQIWPKRSFRRTSNTRRKQSSIILENAL